MPPPARDRKANLFSYRATDGAGRVITGAAEAPSAAALARRLRDRGYRVQRVQPDRRTPAEREAEQHRSVAKLVRAILREAATTHADAVRVARPRAVSTKPVTITYLVRDRWHEVMAVPQYVWPSLRRRLADLAGVALRDQARVQTGCIRRRSAGKTHDLRVTFRPTTILLRR